MTPRNARPAALLALAACTSAGPGADADTDLPIVDGPTLRQLAAFQAVEVPLWRSDAVVAPEDRGAPLIVGRPGVVRGQLQLPDGADAADVTLELTVRHGGVEATYRADAASQGDAAEAAARRITVTLPPSAFTEDATLVARVLTPDGVSDRIPDTGELPLAAMVTGPLDVRFVPFLANGFAPDTSDTMLNRIRDALFAIYPVTDVTFTLAPAETWEGPVDLGAINVRVGELQEAAMWAGEVPWNTYYYGLVTGVADRTDFAGISGTSEDGGDDPQRAFFASGAGFPDDRTPDTVVHELGHLHGLAHAPCDGEDNPDPNYPFPDGTIGTEGWDLRTGAFVPATTLDMMTYCYPRWISAYHYARIAEHVVRAQGFTAPE